MFWRMLMFYVFSSLVRNFMGGKQGPTTTNVSQTPGGGKVYPASTNLFRPGEIFDLYLYLSPTVRFEAARYHKYVFSEGAIP